MWNQKTEIEGERWAAVIFRTLEASIRDIEAERVTVFYSNLTPSFSERLKAKKIELCLNAAA